MNASIRPGDAALPTTARHAAGLVAALLLCASPLPGATQQDARLRLSPDVAFPLQEITVEGLPDSLAGLALRAVPLDARDREAGDAVSLYAVRLEAGDPVFVAPPHPAGLDADGRFRIEPEDPSMSQAPVLTVRALPAAAGQTTRLLGDLERIVGAIVRSSGGDVERLRTGPIEDVPLHLVGAAISLQTLETAGEDIPPEELVWADRWLATRAAGRAFSELADELASLRSPPDEVTGNGGSNGAKVGAADSYPFRFASAGPTIVERVTGADAGGRRLPAPRPPWEKVEICQQCPGALNHWMTVQTEMERGYGNLAERLAGDRDLFDFSESLQGPDPDPTTQKLSKGLSKARSEARKRAGNPLKNLKTPGAARGLALLEAVTGVAKLTLGLNDKFLTALLPSELLPASVGLFPRRFNEDDKRAEPTESGAGEWRLLVTARSAQLEFSSKELLGYFSSLKSILGKTESGVFGKGDKGSRSGVCVPGGTTDEGTAVGTGEAACDLAGDAIGKASKTLKKYEKARKAIDKAQEAREADDAESLPEPDFDPIQFGPYVWPGIDVSDPQWSTARPLGACVHVMAQTWETAEAPWTSMSYSPADPGGSWGGIADQANAPDIGIKPAEVGDCDVRISTRADKFGDAAPVHLDVPTGVDAITVQVDPSPITVEPGDTVSFEPTVRNADSVDVAWTPTSGSGTIVNCDAGIDGRPCYDWIAPELEKGECRRPVTITAESTARRGLRRDGEPTRDGDGAVTVKDPGADLGIAYRGAEVSQVTLEPEEDAPLAATGEAAREGDVRWEASAGSIGGTGRRTTYDPPDAPGTYYVTASTEESESCTPSIEVIVKGETEHRYFGRLQGEVGTASKGPSCGSDGLPLSRGWIDWVRREGDWMAALESDTELAAHILTQATGGFPMPTEQAREMLKAAVQGPVGAPNPGSCRMNRPYYGRMQVDVRDLSELTDSWPGNPITQAVQVSHSAAANRRSLTGSMSARSRATLLERSDNVHTFAMHLSGSTRGQCGDAPGATQRGALGCDGEAFGFFTWGRLLQTAEPVDVRVTLRAETGGHGLVTAVFIPMAVMDERAPLGVPTSPTMNAQPLTVVASPAMQAATGGMGAKIRERLAELSPAERAQAEAMMGGDLEEMMGRAMEVVDQMQDGTADGIVPLPGPPEGRDEITYYLMTMVVFSVDPADRDASGENARFRGGFDTGTTSASVVSRIERLEGPASGAGPAPELPGLEEVEATVQFGE